jgi:hypothetical protein
MAGLALGAAPGAGVSLEVRAPTELRAGARALLDVTVVLPANAAEPVLLTQSAEGEALEVVRGRFMRSDARDTDGGVLRFELPVLARAVGAGVVRVHALAYVCAPDCLALEREARTTVSVLP